MMLLSFYNIWQLIHILLNYRCQETQTYLAILVIIGKFVLVIEEWFSLTQAFLCAKMFLSIQRNLYNNNTEFNFNALSPSVKMYVARTEKHSFDREKILLFEKHHNVLKILGSETFTRCLGSESTRA